MAAGVGLGVGSEIAHRYTFIDIFSAVQGIGNAMGGKKDENEVEQQNSNIPQEYEQAPVPATNNMKDPCHSQYLDFQKCLSSVIKKLIK